MNPDDIIHLYRKKINLRLTKLVQPGRTPGNSVLRAVRYSIVSKGQRWRPILFLSLLRASGISYKRFLDVACGIECLHCATLVIDDLPMVDNAMIRRGVPTCHEKFGADIATYASHLIFDLGETLIVDAMQNKLKMFSFRRLKDLKTTLARGQCLEKSLANNEARSTHAQLRKQYILKSGALYGYIAELSAVCCCYNNKVIKKFHEFGEEIGIAYQINDDLLDVTEDPIDIGKNVNMDVKKVNYVRWLGKTYAITRRDLHYSRAIAYLKQFYTKRILVTEHKLITEIVNRIIGKSKEK